MNSPGDAFFVANLNFQPDEPRKKVSCTVESPMTLQASLQFMSEMLRNQALSDDLFLINAFVSYDPILDPAFDELIHLKITDTRIERVGRY